MSVPAWLLDFFAAIMLLVAAISTARLLISRRADPDADIDVSHLLMGIAMAGTLTANLSTLPAVAWEVIFGGLTAWFGYRVTREYRAGRGLRALLSEHHAPHLLHSAAMLYMFLALRPATGHTASTMVGMSTNGQVLRLPTLALAFAFLLCGYVVADLDRVPAPRALTRLASPTPTPALALAGVPAATGVTVGTSTLAATSTPTDASTPSGTPPPTATSTPTDTPTTLATSASVATSAPGAAQATGVLAGLLSPQVARGCRIAMGVTMAFMLIIMI